MRAKYLQTNVNVDTYPSTYTSIGRTLGTRARWRGTKPINK